jgi:hypothetical protein
MKEQRETIGAPPSYVAQQFIIRELFEMLVKWHVVGL